MDSIDPPPKIPPPLLQRTMITQKADEKEPQREAPEFQGRKKTEKTADHQSEDEEAREFRGIDILV